MLGAEKSKGRATTMYNGAVQRHRRDGFRQELFGLVATLTTARDVDHTVSSPTTASLAWSANTVHTTDEAQAQRFARELECGGALSMATAPATPAYLRRRKKSGFGRELSHFACNLFCNADVWKTVANQR
ncbi:aldehyde dehydrogenase family protein [Klebsiella pneumoniae]|nr:aldehyde dehydrogenase family protein [Klebsiella pneumoniae]